MRTAFAVAISCLIAAPALAKVPVTVLNTSTLNSKEIAERERVERGFCKRARSAHGDLGKMLPIKPAEQDRLGEFLEFLERGGAACPKDPDLAIALIDYASSGTTPVEMREGWIQMQARMLSVRGRPEDRIRAEELARIIWLRGDPGWYGHIPVPQWTDAERRAFIARDDVWAFLLRSSAKFNRFSNLILDAQLDPLSPRVDAEHGLATLEARGSAYDLQRAARLLLEGQLLPADPGRAEALLWQASRYDDGARLQLLDLLKPRLAQTDRAIRAPLVKRVLGWFKPYSPPSNSALQSRLSAVLVPELAVSDPNWQRDAAGALTTMARNKTPEALPPVLGWIDAMLQKPGDPRQADARIMLGQLVIDDLAPARQLLDREIARSGGLVDAGAWTPDPKRPVKFEDYMTPNDYPTRAMREEREGLVKPSAIMSPDGRAVLVEVEPSGSPDLDKAVRSALQRRLRRVYAEHSGRYVRISLPAIQFRIKQCGETDAATAPIPGAVVVDANRNCTVYNSVPVVLAPGVKRPIDAAQQLADLRPVQAANRAAN